VTEFTTSTFKVGIAPETLRRTNLGSLEQGSKVNLERAMLASTRMGGHVVQGHVDTVATIIKKTPDGNAVTYRLQPREKEWLKYVVEKGFISLDGASLTVTNVNDEEAWWEVMLVAYTQGKIVMGKKEVGDGVNVEVDMVGKYVEKSVLAVLLDQSRDGGGLVERIVQKVVAEKVGKS
jgi:riboflavin synthase